MVALRWGDWGREGGGWDSRGRLPESRTSIIASLFADAVVVDRMRDERTSRVMRGRVAMVMADMAADGGSRVVLEKMKKLEAQRTDADRGEEEDARNAPGTACFLCRIEFRLRTSAGEGRGSRDAKSPEGHRLSFLAALRLGHRSPSSITPSAGH